jgi:dUTP pyrophosphatase
MCDFENKNDDNVPVMYLYTDNEELKKLYIEAANKHNQKVKTTMYADSGFDLYAPTEIILEPGKTFMLNYEVKCAMYENTNTCRHKTSQAFCLYSRSSIYKFGLRLVNCVGIIDRGYRGNIGAVFDVLPDAKPIEKHQRLTQICHPNLEPFMVYVVDYLDSLGKTARGEGGFGSTGTTEIVK